MDNNERKLSEYIDRLNAEQKPEAHEKSTDSPELEELFQTVRLVRSLKDPKMPDAGFQQKLAHSVADQLAQKKPAKNRKWLWLTGVASVAAILFLAMMMNAILPYGNSNLVYAMEKAYQDVQAYHGYLEIVETNAAGESSTQAKFEVWANKKGHYYIKGLEGAQKDIITVNNGQQKWQVHPNEKQVHVFSPFPDPYRFTFELGKEIEEVKNALTTTVIGDDMVAGRKASILEVSPQGGVPYRIWIDQETKLPLQKQSAMQYALQYTVTYTEFELVDAIPEDLTAYHVPGEYEEINTNPEQIVTDLNEVQEVIGFSPNVPKNIPAEYNQERIAIISERQLSKLYYSTPNHEKKVIVIQGKAYSELKPVPTAILGKVNDNIAEIQSPVYEDLGVLGGGGLYAGQTDISSIRWQEDGFEYAVVGNAALDDLVSFTQSLTHGAFEMLTPDEETSSKPEVEVPVDLEVEENDQKSVDAGSSPWKLDPAFVAQVFVSLQMSPEGITGEYPIQEENLHVLLNTGEDAIVEISAESSPIQKVYLKKLIRQDVTGIWTVVGYDKPKTDF